MSAGVARHDALEGARQAVVALRAVTSPAELLARAPASLCAGCGLERALVSIAAAGALTAEAVALGGADRAAERAALSGLRAEPIALEHPLAESELLRRRRPAIVDPGRAAPRTEPRLAELLGPGAYAAAPLVIGRHAIGIVHAARAAGEPVDETDRDVLWEFAGGLARAYETATLRRALREEREQLRRFTEWLGARSGELTDAPLRLGALERGGVAEPGDADAPADGPAPADRDPPAGGAASRGDRRRDDRVVFAGLLTRRELDVLRLLAEGNSNKQIAAALVISEGTVKFHVNGILRKLRVANRAEAVARYLRLLGMRAP